MTALHVTGVTSELPDRLPAVLGNRLGAGSTIEIDPTEVGSGSGGAIFRVVTVDGHPCDGLLVKRHDGGPGVAPEQNAAVLAALHEAIMAAPDVAAGERLIAVPFWVGSAEWGGQERIVSLVVDLVHLGYEPLDDAFEGSNLQAWVKRPLEDRILLAIDAVEELGACEHIGLIHADVNPANLFVNHTTGQCALIDFDSGWVPGAPGDRPLVWGKPDGFVAPEVRSGGKIDPSLVGVMTERWSLGILLHHLLFGRSPFFFLLEGSDVAIAAYLRRFSWPDIDQYSDLINQRNRSYYNWYVQELAELPTAAVETFRTFAEDGSLRPVERPGATEWVDALRSAIGPPGFASVGVSADFCASGQPVRVTWDAPGASEVRVEGEAGLPPSGQLDVVLTRSGPIHLLAANAQGTDTYVTNRVTVIRVPEMHTKDPAIPEVSGVTPPRVSVSLPQVKVPKGPRATGASGGQGRTAESPGPASAGSRSGSGRPSVRYRQQALRIPRLRFKFRRKS